MKNANTQLNLSCTIPTFKQLLCFAGVVAFVIFNISFYDCTSKCFEIVFRLHVVEVKSGHTLVGEWGEGRRGPLIWARSLL